MDDFTGQVAIVTGAGQGIGLEIAKRLAVAGAAVVVNDLDPSLAQKAAADIAGLGGKSLAFPGDASDVAVIDRMIEATVGAFGSLTLAVANAGLSLYGNFFTYSPSDFDRVMRLNLGGSFFLAQAASKQMIRQKSGGSLLFMSSVVGHQALPDLAAYAVTKAGLEMLARNLVLELSPHRITVNAVAPGATRTERTDSFGKDYEAGWSDVTPMGRPATVADIASAALFLLSPTARHITGQSLVIDGGWSRVNRLPPVI